MLTYRSVGAELGFYPVRAVSQFTDLHCTPQSLYWSNKVCAVFVFYTVSWSNTVYILEHFTLPRQLAVLSYMTLCAVLSYDIVFAVLSYKSVCAVAIRESLQC